MVPGAAGVTKIDKITTTSYSHIGLTNGDKYFYVVTAVKSGSEGKPSVESSATPMPPAPGAPMNVAATSGDMQVQLSWSPVLDATSYNVYWSKSAGVAAGGAGVTKIPGVVATSFAHTGLTNGDTYYYKVSATGMAGESALSAEQSARPLPAPPPAPLGLTAVAAKDALEIAVQWFDVPNYPSSTAPIQLGYNLYRGLQPGVATYFKDPDEGHQVRERDRSFHRHDEPRNRHSLLLRGYGVCAESCGCRERAFRRSVGDVRPCGGGGGGGGGGGDEGFGNNLSFPIVFADGYGLSGLKISGTWPGVGPFATLPTFDFNTGLRPLSTETLTAFPNFDSSTAVPLRASRTTRRPRRARGRPSGAPMPARRWK